MVYHIVCVSEHVEMRQDCVTQEERSKLKLEQQCASRILPLVKDHCWP